MSDLKVNFSALSTAAADIGSGAGQLEQVLANMDRSLQPLRANWTGEASASYEASKAKWTAAITDMKALLADIGRAVGSSAGNTRTAPHHAGVWSWCALTFRGPGAPRRTHAPHHRTTRTNTAVSHRRNVDGGS